jgi:hypothetical protein
MKVLSEIESEFKGVSAPAPGKWLHPNCKDDSDLEELRKYRHWQDIPKESIERGFLSLSVASADAFRFLLPAYLRYVTQNIATGDAAVLETIFYDLNPFKKGKLDEFRLSHFKKLTHAENAFICKWLTFMLNTFPDRIDTTEVNQALRYWENLMKR